MSHESSIVSSILTSTVSGVVSGLSPAANLQHGFLRLPGKESAKLAYTFCKSPSNDPVATLIVFVNGLMLPRSPWEAVMHHFYGECLDAAVPCPPMLSYDRYGQGDSEQDPKDATSEKEEGYGHDVMDAVDDLHGILLHLGTDKFGHIKLGTSKLILVCNSIGCAIARLFAQRYPSTVCGLLFLDSIIANSDLVSFIPDPDAPNFKKGELPDGVTLEMLRETRKKFMKIFHPSVKNAEGLDRRSLPSLLPSAHGPKLVGLKGNRPFLTVVGHDPEKFAEDGETGSLEIPRAITTNYHNPFWAKYNQDLVHITDSAAAKGPITAELCGHFIQRDDPVQVARLLFRLVSSVREHGW
ncbi:hypothetical protein EJ05DRAFT_482213 [Pseudovirgaria hyperparasitica]|uniref:AB hydrolase-1 domain-containing protein n=1 Tax=Pseudovirgaria hyperparasitica TaxID=470096 RepID=A0A6A6WMF9_9PEZI|nr:uncharacterized protein EJ05DRAFT_482213 [Pseudovirgaria hyperparasitica]KAF2763407.1 hypothetical protein EJ05DRAFT_482213 [Pseudovirgaria hyperparasitica]